MAVQDLKVLKVNLESLAREEREDHQGYQENRYNASEDTYKCLHGHKVSIGLYREDQVMMVHLGLMESQEIQASREPREEGDWMDRR